jgi:DNA-binding transcriptional ArsR family regulator
VIIFHLRPTDLAGIRFAFSPLWECVAAFRAWRAPRSAVARREWAGFFDAVDGRDDWPVLRALALGPTGAIPDFLAPPPARPLVRFADEIAALRVTSPKVIADELRHLFGIGHAYGRTTRDAARLLGELAAELTSFWHLAIAPAWPRILACLEAEVVFRSRVLAFGGMRAVFGGLHRDVRFTARAGGGIVRVSSGGGPPRNVAGRGLLLVPSIFAWPDVYAVSQLPWRPTIAFPARGVAELWTSHGSRHGSAPDRLVALLGTARARVLRLLSRQRTTLELAKALRASPATVSAHVSRLREAGVVDRTRSGRRVFYSLNECGHTIVRAATAQREPSPEN